MTLKTTTRESATECASTAKPPASTGGIAEQPCRPKPEKAISRQQRLGILYNPNHAPLPPARRAALLGKWPSLRSSRRPRTDPGPNAARELEGLAEGRAAPSVAARADSINAVDSTGEPETGLLQDTAGNGLRIDTARLMAAVADLGQKQSDRQAFGAGVGVTQNVSDTPEGARPAGTEAGAANGQVAAAHGRQLPRGYQAGRHDRFEAGLHAVKPVNATSNQSGAAVLQASPFPRLDPASRTAGGLTADRHPSQSTLRSTLVRNGIAIIVIGAAASLVLFLAILLPAA